MAVQTLALQQRKITTFKKKHNILRTHCKIIQIYLNNTINTQTLIIIKIHDKCILYILWIRSWISFLMVFTHIYVAANLFTVPRTISHISWPANRYNTDAWTDKVICRDGPTDTGCSGKIVFFFTIHRNPSLAYIAVRDLQSSQRNASVKSLLLARVSDPHFFLRIWIRAKIFMRIRILGVSGGGCWG